MLQVEEEAVWAQRELAAAVKEAEEESVRVQSVLGIKKTLFE